MIQRSTKKEQQPYPAEALNSAASEACIREIKEEEEARVLSPYAQLSSRSRGRLKKEKPCEIRSCYERDIGRILYSREFRRLRQKTQVFFNPRNDHICTRMEHVLYVSYIAKTIGSALGLNTQLIEAIALGHDLGHAPFGHSGERELNQCLISHHYDRRFKHEAQSLRVVDILAGRNGKNQGLNLSFEVRDGIVSHCGEKYRENELIPLRRKSEAELQHSAETHLLPATLEGCVVRMADKIAYVGRDIEDAARSGLMSFEDLPRAIRSELGRNNGEIVNSLVLDIVRSSRNKDAICLSSERAESMEALLNQNVSLIYQSAKIKRYEMLAKNMIQGLFEAYLQALEDPEKLARSQEEPLRHFAAYLEAYPDAEAGPEVKICDYIAGMSDHFATQSFNLLYQI